MPSEVKIQQTPAPNQYSVTDIFSSGPKVKIGTEPRVRSFLYLNDNPGPGNCDPTPVRSTSRGRSFGLKIDTPKNSNPGPGHYTPNAYYSTKVDTSRTTNRFKMGEAKRQENFV